MDEGGAGQGKPGHLLTEVFDFGLRVGDGLLHPCDGFPESLLGFGDLPLTATEARRLLHAAHGDRLHALYELALRTGLRKGELLGLHWDDLDLDGGTASIHRSLQRTRSQGLTVLNTKTLASERRIALPTECLSSLKIHQERQQEERQTAGTSWTDNGLVFTTPNGRPLDPTNLTRRLLHSAGLRTIRFHDLRHSTATLLLEQGVDLVVIKELLGHAHIGVTAGVYAHVRLRLQRQAIDTLGSSLSQTDTPDDPPTPGRRPLTLPLRHPKAPPGHTWRGFRFATATERGDYRLRRRLCLPIEKVSASFVRLYGLGIIVGEVFPEGISLPLVRLHRHRPIWIDWTELVLTALIQSSRLLSEPSRLAFRLSEPRRAGDRAGGAGWLYRRGWIMKCDV